MEATISGDIINSTSLKTEELMKVQSTVKELLGKLESRYDGFWGRLVKGDSLECYLPDASQALRIALIVKTRLKMLPIDCPKNSNFSRYRVRMALGVGTMRVHDKTIDMLDGEAIYMSGRRMEKKSKPSQGTLFLESSNIATADALQVLCLLVDALINDATPLQCEMLYYKLLSYDEMTIAKCVNKSKSSVYTHLQNVHWSVIEKAMLAFEKHI